MLKMTRVGLLTVFATASSWCYANPPEQPQSPELDRDMLEFLAEFDEMDDEEFELLISYAKKDSQNETVESEVSENE